MAWLRDHIIQPFGVLLLLVCVSWAMGFAFVHGMFRANERLFIVSVHTADEIKHRVTERNHHD